MTYPHVSELFAMLETDLEASMDRQYFGVDFQSKQIWKRCCKKSVDNYNAIPSLNILIAINSFDQRPVRWSFEGLLALIFFSQLPGDLQAKRKSGK